MIDALSGLFALLVRRPWAALAAIGIVTAGLLVGASGVSLDGDLARLLPESAESVQGLDNLQRVYGDQIGRITVILEDEGESPDPEALAKVAEELADQLEPLEGVDRVEAQKPSALLSDYRLLYLEMADLETVQERISKRIKWEKKRANPLFVDLGGGEPPDVDVSDIEAKYTDGADYYLGESGELLVFVRPNFSATDLNRTDELVNAVRNTTQRFLDETEPSVSASYTGRYVKRVEQQRLMIADIGTATLIAFILLALLLMGYFRSVVTTIQVITPLVVGTAAAMTIATLLFGSLNILTGFLGAILLGLGVDYGIHLVSRLQDERRERTLDSALRETFQTTGRANLFAGLTTAAALGSLTVSSFRAFFEFGIIALIGITCILVAYLLVLPSLAAIGERFNGNQRPSLASLLGTRFDAWLSTHDSSEELAAYRKARKIGMGVLVAAVVLGALGAWQVDFDTSFDNLTITDTESWTLDQRVNEILGESQTPAVVLVDDLEHEEAVVEALAERKKRDPEAIQKVISRRDILPPNQVPKVELLRSIRRDLLDVPKGSRSDELKEFLAELDAILQVAPLEMSDLPGAVRKPFSRSDGEGSVVLVLPGLDLNDLSNSRRFVQAVRDLPGAAEGESVSALSDAMLLVEIFEFVQEDIIWMIIITSIGLVLIAFLAFGFRRDAFVLLGTLATSLGAALGVLGLTGVDFNFINVMVIPIWLGLGVDASFHILMHIRRHPDRVGQQVTTVGAVSAAFLTSMTGFGAMSVSHHNGLASLASVALLGLASILTVNVAAAILLSSNEQLRGEASDDER